MAGGLSTASGPVVPHHDPGEVEDTTRQILAEPRFHHHRSDLSRFFHWLGHEISRFYDDLFGHHGGGGTPGGSVLSVFIVVILAAVVLGLIFVIGRELVRSGRRGGRRKKKSPEVHVSVEDLGLPADEWVTRAEAAEAGGDWREGVRCRYRALLSLLVGAGTVDEAVGRTAGTYLTMVRAVRPPAGEVLGPATTTFERTWYGPDDPGPATRDQMTRAYDALRSLLSAKVGQS